MAITPRNMQDYQRLLDSGNYTWTWGEGFTYNNPPPASAPSTTTTPIPEMTPEAVGLEPATLAATLYGKILPLWVGGVSLIGGRIIEGPLFSVIDGGNVASWIAGYCIPANYANNTRTVRSLRLDSIEAWNSTAGALMSGLNVSGATTGTEQRVRFTTGTLAQQPDAWSVAHFDDRAIAYVPMVTATFQNIQLAPFGNTVPFTSIEIADSHFGDPDDGVTWEEVTETLASYEGRTAAEFDAVDLTGRIIALIIASPTTFPGFLSAMRTHKPHWNIRTTDKLYLIEKGPLSLDLTVDRAKLVAKGHKTIIVDRGDVREVPRERLVTFIDVDRDYEPTSVRAAEDDEPVPGTDAFETESVNLPIVSTAVEMLAESNFALYSREMMRQTTQYTGAQPYLGVEPGDIHRIPTDFIDLYQRVTEVSRKPDLQTDIKGDGFLTCAIAQPIDEVPVGLIWWQKIGGGAFDKAGMGIAFFDIDDVQIGSTVWSEILMTGAAWTQRTLPTDAPSGTVRTRLYMEMQRVTGIDNDGYIDDIELFVDGAPVIIVNPGAESALVGGVPPGWTNEVGGLDRYSGFGGPHSGTWYFFGGYDVVLTRAYQDIYL